MTDVKIVVAGIEMTPEQARKVHAELSRLFEPPAFFLHPESVSKARDRIAEITRPAPTQKPPQPGQRAPDWGRYPDSPYVLTSGLQKQGGGS